MMSFTYCQQYHKTYIHILIFLLFRTFHYLTNLINVVILSFINLSPLQREWASKIKKKMSHHRTLFKTQQKQTFFLVAGNKMKVVFEILSLSLDENKNI